MNVLKLEKKLFNERYEDLWEDMRQAWLQEEESQQKMRDWLKKEREIYLKYHGNIFQKMYYKLKKVYIG